MNLKAIREAKNIRQEELARMTGISQSNISKIENGTVKSTSLINAKKIANAIGCSIEDILDDE